jgi:LCP family protein required for cell wall assembly
MTIDRRMSGRRACGANRAAASRRRWPYLLLLGVGLTVIAATSIGVDVWRINGSLDRVAFEPTGEDDGATTYLLLGSDARPDSWASITREIGRRADVIALVQVPDDEDPSITAIPRDLLLDFPQKGEQRLALALLDGPQQVADVLCAGLGIGVDHVVVANFAAFEALVDAVGGIVVENARPVRDDAAGLFLDTADRHRLDGATALAYVRSRQPSELVDGRWVEVAAGAAWRQEHIREVLGAIGRELTSMNPLEMRSAAVRAVPHLEVDEGMGLGELRALASAVEDAQQQGPAGSLSVAYAELEVPVAALTPAGLTELDRLAPPGLTPSCSRPDDLVALFGRVPTSPLP